jgi:hypothetical protein
MDEKKEFKYPLFNEKGKVICQICGKPFMILTPSHLKTHGLKYSEYSNKFPGAPTTTEEFKALSMYSKPSKYSKEDLNILGDEKVVDEDIPVISDDFELPKAKKPEKKIDKTPMGVKKREIFEFLVEYLPHLKMDYQIEIKGPMDQMFGAPVVFSTISDFADPVLKINFEFPGTFWHNMVFGAEDPNRETKLKGYGWKVITIKSKSPSTKEIAKKLKELNLYS